MADDLKLGRLSFIMLGVRDLSRSVAFYRDMLGLRVKSEVPGFAFLDGNGVTIALSEPLGTVRRRVAGYTEIVYSVQSVRAMYEELQRRGVKFMNEPHQVSARDWAAAFSDPDGHAISIFGPEEQE